jgi:hypothetical protein
MRYSLLSETAGGVRAILIPSVCRTVSTLPNWQVSLPFSRSMMKRRPVPEVSAKSFLRDAQPFPTFAGHLANFLYGVSHWLTMTIPVRE